MTKQEAIKHLEFLKIAAEIQAKPERVETEALDMAIETLKGTKAFCEIRYDKDELERLVYEAKEEIKKDIIAGIIDDLNELYEAMRDVDTVPPKLSEYLEIMEDLKEKIKKYQEVT